MISWAGTTTSRIRIGGIVVVTLVFAVLAFERRWMADDGLIAIRTVRQLLDGNGPVFNAFERTEANTSALWTYLLALLGISGANLAKLAVYTGLVLSSAALAIAMSATSRVRDGVLPGTALVLIGVPPFWDFATSGLETGLGFAWIACAWWLLVRIDSARLRRTAFVLGLGPLVRPDLAVVSLVFFVAVWWIERPSWRRVLQLVGIAIALPLAYEIFRAGYYGTLVPLPALAKSATESAWSRGFTYLREYGQPYVLLLPVAVAALLTVVDWRQLDRRTRVVICAPMVAGAMLALYFMRVGGDFMHGRLLLMPTMLLFLPTFMLPLRKSTMVACAALATWAIAIALARPTVRGDERAGYTAWTRRNHPIDARVFVHADRPMSTRALLSVVLGQRRVLGTEVDVPMNPGRPGPLVYVAGRLGTAGAVAPLNAIVADTLGLANPIGARIAKTLPGFTGHEKLLPRGWLLADFADPSVVTDHSNAARRTMKCGELAELLESVRAPMTPSRFWANLVGSVRRTRLVIPADPVEAEIVFCAGAARATMVRASSSWELDGWGKYRVIDGVLGSTPESAGFTAVGPAPQWVALRFPQPRRVSKVVLHPAIQGGGMPVDFTIQVWSGGQWRERVRVVDGPAPVTTPQTYTWTPADETTSIRVVATRYYAGVPRPAFELGEIEVE